MRCHPAKEQKPFESDECSNLFTYICIDQFVIYMKFIRVVHQSQIFYKVQPIALVVNELTCLIFSYAMFSAELSLSTWHDYEVFTLNRVALISRNASIEICMKIPHGLHHSLTKRISYQHAFKTAHSRLNSLKENIDWLYLSRKRSRPHNLAA